jgi:hypothetical protein
MKKGQSQIVSAIIVVLVILTIVGTVFPWASSVIQKKKDSKSVEDVYNFFNQLEASIIDIARNGGEESLELKIPGKITVYPEQYPDPDLNNSIVFEFASTVSNVAETGGWVPLNTPNVNSVATQGIDKPGVIFARSSLGDGEILVWYRLWFRELEDIQSGKSYKISIGGGPGDVKQSLHGFIRIQKVGTSETGGLIRTQLNIII